MFQSILNLGNPLANVFSSFASMFLAIPLWSYWTNFVGYWGRTFGSLGGVVLIVMICGIIGILIIVRGKWIK